MEKIYNVGIIGGGVSGTVVALQLAENGTDNILFEQKSSVVNGPPFCHLHAGGNLYPDITDEECRILMRQSIEMANLFPESIDERPTFFSIPKTVKYEPSKIEARLEMLVNHYKALIKEDSTKKILGEPENYYKKYTKEDIKELMHRNSVTNPISSDDWMINTLKFIDSNQLKFPVFMVQEFGWNMFRLAAHAELAFKKSALSTLKTNSKVQNIKDVRSTNQDHNWEIECNGDIYKVKYLVNSSGFKTGEFDDILNIKSKRLIEFKAAYISKWKSIEGPIPELIFHGERGTPKGMAQLTPCKEDYYQIHGMTKDITLFKDGVIQSNEEGQPEFKAEINQKIDNNWDSNELHSRTQNAIDFVTNFISDFESAKPSGQALFGAQQVVGTDLKLRVAEVSFPSKGYARCEIIKASSALTVANQIIEKLQEERIITLEEYSNKSNSILESITKEQIDSMAIKLTTERGYPKPLSYLYRDKQLQLS